MALDTLCSIGFPSTDPDIQRAIAWFVAHQEADGLWPIDYGKGRKVPEMRCWVGLAVCTVLRRFFG